MLVYNGCFAMLVSTEMIILLLFTIISSFVSYTKKVYILNWLETCEIK